MITKHRTNKNSTESVLRKYLFVVVDQHFCDFHREYLKNEMYNFIVVVVTLC